MNKDYRYQLESKRLTGHQPRKLTCPHCGKKKCFVRYVDTQNGFRYVAGTFYLLQTLPTAGSQRSSEKSDSQFLCFPCRLNKPQREALLTASASFRLFLQSADTLPPCLMVVVSVYPANAQRLGVTLALDLADVVLIARPDVGVIIKDGGAHVVLQQPLDNGRRTGCTAGV